MHLSDLSLPFDSAALAEMLADWRWLELEGTPFLVTLFGDVLFRSDDGAIRLLDTLGGTYRELAPDQDAFAWALLDPDFLEDCFLSSLASHCLERGMRPGEGECLTFKRPPVLGGVVEAGNVEAASLRSHHALMAGVHERALDPGAQLS